MFSTTGHRADFSVLRYAQCWEDADILLEALDIQPGDICLSIASAGDNTLAMLTRGPAKVLALDLSVAQLAVLELRVAAYRELPYPEMLGLIGSIEWKNRAELYARCRKSVGDAARRFWDDRPELIQAGIGSAGKFEHYFSLFRRRALPLVHTRKRVESLLAPKTREERLAFYDREWNNFRWRFMFRVFFSRFVMGHMGRDPEFFRYVQGGVAERILERTRYALTELDPATNPYVRWILEQRHTPEAIPCALRPENFEIIRKHLDRLQWRCSSLEEALESEKQRFDCFNLSDVFEYMSPQHYERALRLVVRRANPGARLAYWNMLAPRSRPESMTGCLFPRTALAGELFAKDKAFFYSALIAEEVR